MPFNLMVSTYFIVKASAVVQKFEFDVVVSVLSNAQNKFDHSVSISLY